jgi:outer membrane receptor protein involved in Fe transport
VTAENSFGKRDKVRAAVAAILGATLSGGLMSPARAQQAPADSATSQPVTLEEVTVTGSRIKRTSDFTTPTPTTVIDSDLMQSLGMVNVGQAIAMTPANISTFSPTNTGNSSFFTGSYIPDLRGLNPFFGTRTLTLIDTRRAVQTTQGDSFDLNFIPQILVQRIDTVTGGASAAYGSGAISGVINVILDHKLEGGKFDADIYQTSYSDGRDRHVAGAYGHGLFDDRVHFVVGGEYEKQDPVGCQDARSWCAQDVGFYQTGVVGNNIATYSLGRNLRSNVISDAGAFFPPTGNAGAGIASLQASGDGLGVLPYMTGVTPLGQATVSNNSMVVGGDGNPINKVTNLSAPVTRGVITGMVTAKVTDSINFNADVNWGKVESQTFVPGNTSQPTILPAFGLNGQNIIGGSTTYNDFVLGPQTLATLPNGFIAQNAALGNPSLLNAVNNGYNAFNKDWTGQIPLAADTTTTVRRFSAGFDGKFGDSSWTWDAYAEYGLTHREQLEPNEIRAASYQMALDSVMVNGTPECRVTAAGGIQNMLNPANPYYNPLAAYAVTGVAAGFPIPSPVLAQNALLAQGCVPINPFGTGAVSPAAQQYAFGNLDERLRYEQTVAAFNSSGNIWDGLGAGPWALAAGFEWRHEVGHNDEGQSCLPGDDDATCAARSQDFAAQFGTPFAGGVTVNEVYVEANMPLLKDQPGAHLLTVDVAARESRYMTDAESGITYTADPTLPRTADHDLTTWKVSMLYEPVSGVRFRGSQSRDSRAANFRELYYGQQLQSGATGGFGYCAHVTSANQFDDPCTENLFGNVNLHPEVSDTTTLGFVLTPAEVQGLQFSADWFHIRIKDAISAASVPEVEQACNSGDAGACGQMTFNNTAYDSTGAQYQAGVSKGAQLTGAAAWQAGADNATLVNAFAFNGAFYDERGVDFSLNYVASLPDGSTVSARALTTWTGEQIYQNYPGGPVLNILGQTGAGAILTDNTPAARWRGNLSVTWQKGMVSLTPSMSWVGHGTLDALGVTPQQTDLYNKVVNNDPSIRGYGYTLLPFNYVPSYFLFNMNGTLNFDNVPGLKGLQLYVQVNNVLNRKPPFASAPVFFGNAYAGTNPVYFDTLGLATRVGFRLSF